MAKRYFVVFAVVVALLAGAGALMNARAQQDGTRFHISVDLVQLNVAVTDNKGNYVTGLKPTDFVISEDGISEKIATFEEGNGPTRRLLNAPPEAKKTDDPTAKANDDPNESLADAIAGSNVFILFDTSNYMYRGFVFAQDAISDFVRSLETADKVAFYSYSRDLYRSAPLTADRSEVVRGVRTTVAGDDAALYNSLLLTLKDAATQSGRKVVVVFSNGQCQHGATGRRCRTRAIRRHPDLHDQHARSAPRTRLHRRLRAHDRRHRRQSLLREQLARRKESLRLDPRRSRPPLFVQLLPRAESQSRLARH
jgi:VWFA-related protein